MKRIIRLSPAAADDLDATLVYLTTYNPEAGLNWLHNIEEFFKVLSQYPSMGLPFDHIRPTMRCAIKNQYRILYRVFDHEIIIIRILHPRRNIKDDLFK